MEMNIDGIKGAAADLIQSEAKGKVAAQAKGMADKAVDELKEKAAKEMLDKAVDAIEKKANIDLPDTKDIKSMLKK